MAQLVVIYWRDIPAQVTAKAGRTASKRELSLRFTEAIDMAAMRSGAAATDDYLAEWRRGEPVPCGDDLEAEVAAAMAKIEAEYDKERLLALVNNAGREPAAD
jgi:NAD(P)-dependent dehydrogenase (short-subunit alcohol dehydrogenase family)